MRWLILILVGGFAGLFLYVGTVAALQNVRLYRQGVATSAEVVENVMVKSTHSRSSSYGYAYHPRFRFTTPDGATHLALSGGGQAPDPEYAVGARVLIRYLPARPESAELSDAGTLWGGAIIAYALGLLAAAGAYFGFTRRG